MTVKLSQVKSASVSGPEAAESREGTFCTGARIFILGERHKYGTGTRKQGSEKYPYGKISVRT